MTDSPNAMNTPFDPSCFALRPATQEDWDFCKRLHHEAYRDVVIRQFGSWDESVQDLFFAEKWDTQGLDILLIDCEQSGCLSRMFHDDHLWIEEIQLLPVFQRRGAGTWLLRLQLDEASKRQIPVRLQVLKANHGAQALYSRLGFRVTGETQWHHVMQWNPPG